MYVLGILAAFISPASHALSNIFDSYVTGNLFKKIPTMVFYANITNALGFLFLYATGPIYTLPPHLFILALIVALINFLYLFPYYMALQLIDTSIVAALFSLGQVFVPFLAYFIAGELLHPGQYIGFCIVLAFSVILNLENPKKLQLNRGFWLMLATAMVLSLENVLYKRILQEADWRSTAFWCLFLTFIIRFSIITMQRLRQDIVRNFSIYKANFGKFLFIEFFDQSGSIAPVFALSLIPVLVNESIDSTQPIFVIIYCFILSKFVGHKFNENLDRKEIIKKIICFIFIGIGICFTIG